MGECESEGATDAAGAAGSQATGAALKTRTPHKNVEKEKKKEGQVK